MYRTKKLAKVIDDLVPELYPICIASYQRPDANLLKRMIRHEEYRGSYLFVRQEEKELYAHWKDFFHLVYLKDVDNVGDTRRKVFNYCVAHGLDKIYLLDDDLTELDYQFPSVTAGGKEAMRNHATEQHIPHSIFPEAMKMWQYIIEKKCKEEVAISSPIYRPFAWSISNANKKITYNDYECMQAVYLNIKLLHENGINYRSTKLVGPSDYAIQFDAMIKGLKTFVTRDIMYGAPAMADGKGGCSASEYDLLFKGDITAVMGDRYERFVKNVCGENHPGIKQKITVKTKRVSPAFNWKYWKEYKV